MNAIQIRHPPNDYIKPIEVTMSVNELIKSLRAAGSMATQVSPWGETDALVWRASSTIEREKGSYGQEFCDGNTIEEALTGVLLTILARRPMKAVVMPLSPVQTLAMTLARQALTVAVNRLTETQIANLRAAEYDDEIPF
jgi:hypothetical protein